jgi:hypothetical protein
LQGSAVNATGRSEDELHYTSRAITHLQDALCGEVEGGAGLLVAVDPVTQPLQHTAASGSKQHQAGSQWQQPGQQDNAVLHAAYKGRALPQRHRTQVPLQLQLPSITQHNCLSDVDRCSCHLQVQTMLHTKKHNTPGAPLPGRPPSGSHFKPGLSTTAAAAVTCNSYPVTT